MKVPACVLMGLASALALAPWSKVLAESVVIGRFREIHYGIDQAHPYAMTAYDGRRSGRAAGRVPPLAPKQRWQRNVGSARLTPPTVTADGTLVVGTTQGLQAHDRHGRLKWSKAIGSVSATPALTPDARLFALAGAQAWLVDLGGDGAPVHSTTGLSGLPLVLESGTVIAGGDTGVMRVMDLSGEILSDVTTAISGLIRTAAVHDHWVVAVGRSTEVVLFSLRTGELRSVRLEYSVSSGPVVGDDGTIWLVDRRGTLLGLSVEGRIRARAELAESNARFPMAVGRDGAVRVGVGNELRCLGPDGTERWRRATDHRPGPISLDADDTAVFLTARGTLYAVERDGSLRWRQHVGATRAPRVVIDRDGLMYVVDRRGVLSAWK